MDNNKNITKPKTVHLFHFAFISGKIPALALLV